MTFDPVTEVTTRADIFAVDNSVMGGDGVLLKRSSINGAPAGSYQWRLVEKSDLPIIRGLYCTSDCIAVGDDNSGSNIITVDSDGELLDEQAWGIKTTLRAVVRYTMRSHAVGDDGTILSRF